MPARAAQFRLLFLLNADLSLTFLQGDDNLRQLIAYGQ
jgi:hypothetical protein